MQGQWPERVRRSTIGALCACAAILSVLAATPGEAAILRVKIGATGAGDGSTWADAFPDLPPALAAAQAGDELWVAAGTYKPTNGSDRTISFAMKTGVDLFGGFSGSENSRTDRDPTANVTTLSGAIVPSPSIFNESLHVVLGADNATLDGFTIANGGGTSSSGGGMVNSGVSPTIANCIFSGTQSGADGGGIYNLNCSPAIVHCTFNGNVLSGGNGGAICNDHASPSISDCAFTANTSTGLGGGIFNTASIPQIVHCSFAQNSAGFIGGAIFGGGIILNSTFDQNTGASSAGAISGATSVTNCIFTSCRSPTGSTGAVSGAGIVSNCIFAGNSASHVGAIASCTTVTRCIFVGNTASQDAGAASGCDLFTNCAFVGNTAGIGAGAVYQAKKIVNCTFYGNNGGGLGAGAIFSPLAGSVLKNCILRNDAPSGSEIAGGAGKLAVDHCDIQGSHGSGGLWPGSFGTDGGGNSDVDPLFADAASPIGADSLWITSDDGLRLLDNSPCRGAGVSVSETLIDILGAARPAPPSIGAYDLPAIPSAAQIWLLYR